MATFLYRLGRLAFRRRRLVTLLWIVVMAAIGVGAAGTSGSSNDSFTIPGSQSQKALDLLDKEFPQASASGATVRVVFEAPVGRKLTSSAKTEVESLVADLKEAPQVASVVDPYTGGAVSKDGTIAYASVTFKVAQADVGDAAKDALHDVAAKGDKAGLSVSMGGNAVKEKAGGGASEAIGIVVAALVLVITFGSLAAAGLPLLTALFGVGLAMLSITIATGLWHLSSSAPTLAVMLGLAVAIDYALFIVSRYRSELADGHDHEEAAGRALGTAGSAVVFAGLTVIIALAGLSIIGIRMMADIGLSAAFAVAIAVLIALTLLPAMLGFAGKRITKGNLKTKRMRKLERGEGKALGVRWARFVTRNPVKMLAVSVVGLLALAVPALSLETAMPDDSTAAPGSSARIAYDTVPKGFGDGYNGPLTVVVDAGSGSAKSAAQDAVTLLDKMPDVASVGIAGYNQSGDVALIRAVPQSAPRSQDTIALVNDIRDQGVSYTKDTGAEMMVTGTTALSVDVSAKLSSALVPYLCVVVGLALILLLLVFRSLMVPLKAAGGFLLGLFATLGVVAAVFQWGWFADVFGVDQTSPIVSVLPIFLVGVVFGLAMDYEVFLATRMREAYVHGAEPKEAVVAGFRHSARVVTAAAIIMISVFGGFVLDDSALIQSIGLGLASAVLFDAFVIRMTLVPAVMTLLGRRAWTLPRWLDGMLPNVDVEGEKLQHLLDKPGASDGEAGGEHRPFSPAASDRS
ncbi:MMPL family transporter [Streptomyces sp. NPDC059092]|uniref:MMPL family transporter n=1 Tax=Streptomyces sp. NPDC059092 TaxID=3346725 RepID=UPI0036B412D5